MATRVGVVLSGCGVFDGSEIHEAVSVLVALDRRGAKAVCAAPNVPLATINHLSGQPSGPARNVLEESARIARGKVRDLSTLQAGEIDALVFPGGFGAAKNLCDFASAGAKAKVQPDVARLLRDCHAAGKPLGLACIAPVLAAAVFGYDGRRPRLTIGTDAATADAITQMGGQHVTTGPTDICVDETNRLVTTPCYMNDVGPATVFEGADKMVDAVLKMIRR